MDVKVLEAQQWVNATYGSVPDYVRAPENGKTGWPTMYALTRALQHELGIMMLSDNFGPGTLAALAAHGEINSGERNFNIVRIIQSACYCKGYEPGGITGNFDNSTAIAIHRFLDNAGLGGGGVITISPKAFKALLTMDAYVVLAGGKESIRRIQQWLNRRYVGRRDFFIIPCDGIFSRDVQKALYLAIQFELGMTDNQATGVFGPATRAGIRVHTLSETQQSVGIWVELFSAAMVFNQVWLSNGTIYDDFTDRFSSGLTTAVRALQQFAELPINGTADFATWCQVLVSTGDPDRLGAACDCITTITDARAQALKNAGYAIIGRYLDEKPHGTLNKKLQPGELDTIFRNGLKVFPISQYYGGEVSEFTYARGYDDALNAHAAAVRYGFNTGTVIYFAVDYDATQAEIESNIIPYFNGVVAGLAAQGNKYVHGVYGSRNVCAQVTKHTAAWWSFVSGMSYGFSGNMGFPLPTNWSFNQIQTVWVGSGDGRIEIDKNIYRRGTDSAVSSVDDANSPNDRLDTHFDNAYRGQLSEDLNAYRSQVTLNTRFPKHSMDEALDVVIVYDELITNVSRSFGVRKALIQSVVFWEYWNQALDDNAGDALVQSWYAYKHIYEAWEKVPIGDPPPPPLPIDDCSTGIAQIFARVAIRTRNYAVTQGLISDNWLNADDWHIVEDVWNKLHDDGNYNISTALLVLFEGAAQTGRGLRLNYSGSELRSIFTRYNDSEADEVTQYGVEVYGVYRIFEMYNARIR